MKNQLFPCFFQGLSISDSGTPLFFSREFWSPNGRNRSSPTTTGSNMRFFSHWKAEIWRGKKQTHWIRKCNFFEKKLQKLMSIQLCNFFSAKQKMLRSQLGWLSHQRFFAVAAARLGGKSQWLGPQSKALKKTKVFFNHHDPLTIPT